MLLRYLEVWLDSGYNGARGPYLQRPAADAISIYWQTAVPSRGAVQFAPAVVYHQALQRRTVASSQQTQRHHLRLEGLQADTEYRYQWLVDDRAVGPVRSFWTWPATNSWPVDRSVRVWVLGDPGMATTLAQQVRSSAQMWLHSQRRPHRPLFDLWLTTGDNAYTSGRNREYQHALFEPYHDWLASQVLFPAYGNHDARRRAFFDIFDFPQQGESGGAPSGSEHYYALDYGPLHVLMLDSQDSAVEADSPMMRWLQADLAIEREGWIMAVFHHPPYSAGSHHSDDDSGSDWRMRAMRERVVPVLEAAGVDLILSGHSHAYERSHLLRAYVGMSADFAPHHIVDAGVTTDDWPHYYYQQPAGCRGACGTLYVTLGNATEVRPGTMDHPAMPINSTEGGSLMLTVKPHCLSGGMLAVSGLMVDLFTIADREGACDAPPEFMAAAVRTPESH